MDFTIGDDIERRLDAAGSHRVAELHQRIVCAEAIAGRSALTCRALLRCVTKLWHLTAPHCRNRRAHRLRAREAARSGLTIAKGLSERRSCPPSFTGRRGRERLIVMPDRAIKARQTSTKSPWRAACQGRLSLVRHWNNPPSSAPPGAFKRVLL
jgi:hypothetical protein